MTYAPALAGLASVSFPLFVSFPLWFQFRGKSHRTQKRALQPCRLQANGRLENRKRAHHLCEIQLGMQPLEAARYALQLTRLHEDLASPIVGRLCTTYLPIVATS